MSDPTHSELTAGVSAARLAELTGLPLDTLRHYEALGLVPSETRDGERVYGPAAKEALETVRWLESEGLALGEKRATPQAEAELERLRAELAAGRARLGRFIEAVEARKAALDTARAELEAAEGLRESNRRRALEVVRRTEAIRAGARGLRITVPKRSEPKN